MLVKQRKRIKQNAKRALDGNWTNATASLFLFILLSLGMTLLLNNYIMLFDGVNGKTFNNLQELLTTQHITEMFLYVFYEFFSLLAGLFLLVPLAVGIVDWYFHLVKNEPQEISYIFGWFSCFKRYVKVIKITLRLLLYIFGWTMLFAISMQIVFGCVIFFNSSAKSLLTSDIVVIIRSLASFLFTVIMSSRYFMVYFLLIEEEDTVSQLLFKKSCAVMKGHIGEVLLFFVTFIGLWLLIIPTLGLLFIYVAPYTFSATAMYARYLIELYNKAALSKRVQIQRVYVDDDPTRIPDPEGIADIRSGEGSVP